MTDILTDSEVPANTPDLKDNDLKMQNDLDLDNANDVEGQEQGQSEVNRLAFNSPSLEEDEVENELGSDPEVESWAAGYNLDVRNIGTEPQNVIKVLLLATPDMFEEQNRIMMEVRHRVNKYCKVNHKLDLQILAPHWHPGIEEDVFTSELHEIGAMMLDEAKKAKYCIPVLLLGEKYGWRPPPKRISRKEFEYLIRHLRRVDINGPTYLRNHYDEDKNEDPPICVLKKKTKHSEAIDNTQPEEGTQAVQTDQGAPQQPATDTSYKTLADTLRTSARAALEASHIKEEEYHKYATSVVDMEITEGILSDPVITENTLCFLRKIEQLDEQAVASTRAAEYCDLTAELKIDKEARERVKHLTDVIIPTSFPESQVYKATVAAEYTGIAIDYGCTDAKYHRFLQKLAGKKSLAISKYHQKVNEFANMVENAVVKHIDALVEKDEKSEEDTITDLKKTVLQHWKRASESEKGAYDVEDGNDRILSYLNSNSEQAMVIYGETGTGKTSLVSKCAVSLIKRSEEDEETEDDEDEDELIQSVVVLRMLDKSWGQWTVEDLLWSIAQQLNIAFGKGAIDSRQKYLAEDHFYEALYLATPDKPIYLILDSVDHLITPITMEAMGWLPDILPPNVKVVLSTATDGDENVFEDLQQRIVDDDNFFELDLLDDATAFKIIQSKLTARSRGVNDKQAMLIALIVQNGVHPVFVQMFSDMVCNWTSTVIVDPENPDVLDSADGIINQFIENLEDTHGEMLVAHSLSYISLAQVGLTHDELMDILSLDDTLLSSEIFPSSQQPYPRRFPEILWLRLLFDLRQFLQVIEVNRVTAYRWSHGKFREGVLQRYSVDQDHVLHIHLTMADYFLGTYGGSKMKLYQFEVEIKYDDEGNEVERHFQREAVESRGVPLQPTVYQRFTYRKGDSVANSRKMTELPFHLLHSDRLEELRTTILFNYSWWHAAIQSGSLDQLVEDLEKVLESPQMISDQELELMIETLQDCREDIQPDLNHLRCELSACLMQYLGTHTSISHLIKTCDHFGFHHCRLTPLSPYSEALAEEITNALPIDTGYEGHITIATTNMPDFIVSYTVTERLSVRNVRSGDKHSLECAVNAYYSTIKTSKLRDWVYAVNDTKTKYTYQDDVMAVDIFDIDEGTRVNRITYDDHESNILKTRKLYRLTCLKSKDVVYETYNYIAICFGPVNLYDVKTGENVGGHLPWPHLLTSDEQHLLVADPNEEGIIIREFPEMKMISRLQAPKHVTAMTCIEKGPELHLLTSAGSAGSLTLFDLREVTEGVDLEPINVSILNKSKKKNSKGGVGQFILSPTGKTAIALYVYSIGQKIYQENYLIDTDNLNVIGQYKCGIGESPIFSSDERHIFHLRKFNDSIEIFDASNMSSIATFSPGPALIQSLSSPAAGRLLVVTKEYVLEVDINKVIKKTELKKLCQKLEAEQKEDRRLQIRAKKHKMADEEDSEEETEEITNHKHVVLADLDTTSNWNDMEEKLPVKVMTLNTEWGLVDSHTMDLMRGVHFSEFDLPSLTPDIMLTPDGKNVILLWDQVHIWNPTRSTVLLALPLKEKHGYTRLFVKAPDQATGSGSRKDLFVKDVTMEGLTLEKGAFVFRDMGTRKQVLYEAKGGEIIQRIPSVARGYDVNTHAVTSVVRVQNERLMTCNDKLIITSALAHCFTNIYSLKTGEQLVTMDFKAKVAAFTHKSKYLLLASNGQKNFLRIHKDDKYQTSSKMRLSEHDSEEIQHISENMENDEVTVCVYKPHDDKTGAQAKTFYLRVNLAQKTILSRSQIEGIVHVSSDGTLGVDSTFNFYDITTGENLFKMDPQAVTEQGRHLASHISYLTNDGHYLVCLDDTRGLIVVIDTRGKRVVCTCPYHVSLPTMEKLKGKISLTSLVPLYGGYECIVSDGGSFVKQFCLQTFDSYQDLAHKNENETQQIYNSIQSRAKFFGSHTKFTPVEHAKYLPNLQHSRVVNARTMAIKPGYLGPIVRQ